MPGELDRAPGEHRHQRPPPTVTLGVLGVALPPAAMPVQERLRDAERYVDALRVNVAAQHEDRRALQASLLDQAFRGEL